MNQTTALFADKLPAFLATKLSGESLQLKQMPALPYLPLYAYACKLAAHETELFQIGVSTIRERALSSSIKQTLAAFLHAPDPRHASSSAAFYEGIGLENTVAEAELAGSYRVLEKCAAATFSLMPGHSVRIVDWEASFPQYGTSLENLEDLAGRIELYKIEAYGLPGVAALLRLSQLPHLLGTLSLGLQLSQALEQAVESLLHKFSLYTYQQDAGVRQTAAWCTTPCNPQGHAAILAGGPGDFSCEPWADLDRQYPALDTNAQLEAIKAIVRKNGWSLHTAPLAHDLLEELQLQGVSVRLEQIPAHFPAYEDSFWFLPVACPQLPSMRHMPDGRQDTELSRLYHENSKIHQHQRPDDFIFPPSLIDASMQRVISNGIKDFRYAPLRYKLPDVRERRTVPIEEAILRRRSTLPLVDTPITLEELSHLLYFSYGVTTIARNRQEGFEYPLRAAPSGGALYPVDLYLLIERVVGVTPGIYYYHPHEHELLLVTGRYRARDVMNHVNAAHRLEKSACMVLFVGNFQRNQWKYRERGYRIVNLDCGHLGENLILVSVSLGLVAHGLMGFADDFFNRLLRLDGSEEALLYMMCIGKGTH